MNCTAERNTVHLLAVAFIFMSCSGPRPPIAADAGASRPALTVASVGTELIYEDDSRVNVGECDSDLFQDIALSSVVAIVPKENLHVDAERRVRIDAPLLRQNYDFCDANLAFKDEPTLADCSGVLVGPDLVLTAGHCVDDQNQCDASYVVFDYAVGSGGELLLSADDVFDCIEVLGREVSERWSSNLYDHALLRLNSIPSSDHRPVQVRTEVAERLEPVVLIGNGGGLPTKIDMDGIALSAGNSAEDYFSAQIDNFERGSGSPVFDIDGLLLGIAVRGGVDYDTTSSCFRLRQVDGSSGLSEQVSYAHTALQRILAQSGIGIHSELDKDASNGRLLPETGCAMSSKRVTSSAGGILALTFALALAGRARFVRPCMRRRGNEV